LVTLLDLRDAPLDLPQVVQVVGDARLVRGRDLALQTLRALDDRTATTQADGTYRFVLLPPGAYKVSVSAAGFKTDEIPSVNVAVTESPVLNRSLSVGGQAEQITVEANAETIQTASSALGTVVESKAVTALPLTTRNYTNLLGLSAGANSAVPNATALGRGTMEIAVNGASTAQNTFLMDGVSVVNIASSGVNTEGGTYATFGIPNPDTLAEFKIQTSLYDAGYGRNPGANVNVITKSGTNVFHGTAFEFFRNTALNANDFFRNRTCGLNEAACAAAGGNKLVLNQNQYGGVIGGPIKKDKLFFFTSYQGTNQKNGVAAQGYSSGVNLPAIPLGDRTAPGFTAALGAAFCKQATSTGAGTTQVACDGSNINPIALKFLQAKLSDGSYFMPGSTTGAVQAASYSNAARDQEYQGMMNIDYLINSKNTFSAKYYRSVEPQSINFQGAAAVPGSPVSDPFGYHDALMKLTTIVTNNLVNEARISLQRTTTLPYQSPPTSTYAANIYPGIAPGCNLLGCTLPYSPELSITGVYTAGGSSASDETVTNLQYQIADQVSWTHGKHSIRAGFELERAKWNWIYKGLSRGIENYNNFSDFLVGLPGNCGAASATCNGGTASDIANTSNFDVRTSPGGIIHSYLMRNANAFLQDDVKVSQRLTVNLGLRWEYDGAVSDKYGNVVNLWASQINSVPAPVTTQLPTPGIYNQPPGATEAGWVVPTNFDTKTWGALPAGVISTGHTIPTKNEVPLTNFAPRIGFAWQPTSGNKLVVRGGAGFFYDRVPGNTIIHAVEQSPPYSITLDQSGVGNSFASEAAPYQNIPLGTFPLRWVNFTPGLNAYQESSSLTQTAQWQNYVTPVVYSWNLNLQYELARSWVLEVGYVGARGIHQSYTSNDPINEPLLATAAAPINGLTTNTIANAILRVPYLGFSPSGLQEAMTNGDYKSNSLQSTLRKQLSHGLSLQAAYTWTRAFASNYSSGDPTNSAQQYGLNTTYRPQRVVITYSYDLPGNNIHTLNGFGAKVLGGWSVSGVTTIQDGTPITITDNRGGSIFGQNAGGALSRAEMAPGYTYSQLASPGGIEARLGSASGGPGYFNTSALTTIPLQVGPDGVVTNGTGWGNSGVGSILGPGQFNFDATLAKSTRVGGIHENAALQFQAEFFNLFNHPQFSNPNAAFNSGAFGQITTTSVNQRLVQLALKYVF
jgi:hypothetical protein